MSERPELCVADLIAKLAEKEEEIDYLEMKREANKVEWELAFKRAKELENALHNVRMLSYRLRKTDPENAEHLLRFCTEVGVVGSVMREKEE